MVVVVVVAVACVDGGSSIVLDVSELLLPRAWAINCAQTAKTRDNRRNWWDRSFAPTQILFTRAVHSIDRPELIPEEGCMRCRVLRISDDVV